MCFFFQKRVSYVQNFCTPRFSTSNQGGSYCHHIRNCYTRWVKSRYIVIILYTMNCIPTFGPHFTCMIYINTKLQVTSHFLRVYSHQNKGEIQNMYSDILTVYILQSTYLTLKLLAPTTMGARINPYVTNVIYIYIYIYIHVYGAPILDVSRSHTTTHHSR